MFLRNFERTIRRKDFYNRIKVSRRHNRANPWKSRADNYRFAEIKRAIPERNGNTDSVFGVFERVSCVLYIHVGLKTEATARDRYGPVTEFLAGWEPRDCR